MWPGFSHLVSLKTQSNFRHIVVVCDSPLVGLFIFFLATNVPPHPSPRVLPPSRPLPVPSSSRLTAASSRPAVDEPYEICPYATFSMPPGSTVPPGSAGRGTLDYTLQFHTFGHQECFEGQPAPQRASAASLLGGRRRDGGGGSAAGASVGKISPHPTLPHLTPSSPFPSLMTWPSPSAPLSNPLFPSRRSAYGDQCHRGLPIYYQRHILCPSLLLLSYIVFPSNPANKGLMNSVHIFICRFAWEWLLLTPAKLHNFFFNLD